MYLRNHIVLFGLVFWGVMLASCAGVSPQQRKAMVTFAQATQAIGAEPAQLIRHINQMELQHAMGRTALLGWAMAPEQVMQGFDDAYYTFVQADTLSASLDLVMQTVSAYAGLLAALVSEEYARSANELTAKSAASLESLIATGNQKKLFQIDKVPIGFVGSTLKYAASGTIRHKQKEALYKYLAWGSGALAQLCTTAEHIIASYGHSFTNTQASVRQSFQYWLTPRSRLGDSLTTGQLPAQDIYFMVAPAYIAFLEKSADIHHRIPLCTQALRQVQSTHDKIYQQVLSAKGFERMLGDLHQLTRMAQEFSKYGVKK